MLRFNRNWFKTEFQKTYLLVVNEDFIRVVWADDKRVDMGKDVILATNVFLD